MPIYEYRCSSCGVQKEFIQRLSDPVLTTCPACGKETFSKMLTAAGFQLKGSGWYVTDFRNSGAGHTEKKDAEKTGDTGTDGAKDKSAGESAVKADGKSTEGKGETKSTESSSTAPATTPAASPPPSTASGG